MTFFGIGMFFAVAVTIFAASTIEDVPKEPETKIVGPVTEPLPNLRKILYPTYARSSYGSDLYGSIDVGVPGYGTWSPMYKYNDFLDRSMRSLLRNNHESSVF
uniref:Secreted protein n=1 Tax=Panagrellus redivivus TaxID=6233 RepID=A0A7E4ZWP5_PANRE